MTTMKPAAAVVMLFIVMVIGSGCATHTTARRADERSLTEAEIMEMTRADAGANVINRMIDVNGAKFDLSIDDIVRLKKAGVDEEVIAHMIGTGDAAREADIDRSYDLYDYWFNYYNTFYPVNIHFYPIAAHIGYLSGRFHNPWYRWSGELGMYYRNFPVGTRNWLRWDYPPYDGGKSEGTRIRRRPGEGRRGDNR